jgi:hypothetical protein
MWTLNKIWGSHSGEDDDIGLHKDRGSTFIQNDGIYLQVQMVRLHVEAEIKFVMF